MDTIFNDQYASIVRDGYYPPAIKSSVVAAPAPEEKIQVKDTVAAPASEAPVPFKQGVDIPNLKKDPPRKIDLGHDSSGNEITREAAGLPNR